MTHATFRSNNIQAVLRYPALLLLNVFFVIGPGLFERAHVAEVQRELAAIPVPKLATQTPLKRLPEKQPVHDPATCAICIALHAPMTAGIFYAPAIGLLAQVGYVAQDRPVAFIPIRIAGAQCRGPPAA